MRINEQKGKRRVEEEEGILEYVKNESHLE
jgi:hypothetical protein